MIIKQSQTQRLRITLLILGVLGLFVTCHLLRKCTAPITPSKKASYQRIIALSPSIVEIIYQLGQEDYLVAVSRFCTYPPKAAHKPIVGGYLDLDFEAVIRYQPDCVILLDEQQDIADRLGKLGIQTITVDHNSCGGILSSIQVIGDRLDQSNQAKQVVTNIQLRIDHITHSTENMETKPRVLVCISRETSSPQPDRIIAAGNSGVHQEYIRMAGGTNAYQGDIAFPTISREKLLQLDPDIIIELLTEETWNSTGQQKLLQSWNNYSELKAVKNQNIIFLHENKHLIPGPRFTDTLEVFADAIQSSKP